METFINIHTNLQNLDMFGIINIVMMGNIEVIPGKFNADSQNPYNKKLHTEMNHQIHN